MKATHSNLFSLMAGTLLLACLSLPIHALAADNNALTAAIPDVTKLSKQEACSDKQNHVLSSLGLGNMACAISKAISFDSIGKAIGISAFQPNSRTNPLNPSDNVEDFVRYSPRFFTRVNELYSKDTGHMIYGVLYNNFLKDSTRLFYMTGQDLRDHKNLRTLTVAQYKQATQDSKPLFADAIAQCKKTQRGVFLASGQKERYSETFSKCGKSSTASLFWYRRQLDGSSDALFLLLDNILKTQDNEFYTRLKAANNHA